MLIIDHNNKNNGRGNTTRIMMVRNYFYWFVDSLAATNGILDELQWVSSSINDFLMGVMMIIILLGVFSSFSSWNNKNPTSNWSEIWAELRHRRKKKQFFGKFHLSLVFFSSSIFHSNTFFHSYIRLQWHPPRQHSSLCLSLLCPSMRVYHKPNIGFRQILSAALPL